MNEAIQQSPDYFDRLINPTDGNCQNQNDFQLLEILKKNQLKVALGVSALSIAATVGFQPFDETKQQLLSAAPWVGGGLIAGEALWIGGAAMMTASVGKGLREKNNKENKMYILKSQSNDSASSVDYFEKLLRPNDYPELNREEISKIISLKNQIPQIATNANNSKLFKTGFWVNTTGAVGQFGAITGGVALEAPPSAWGLVSIGFVDLVATLAIRKAILDGIRKNSTTE